jgi:hypothetical protein
MAAALGMLFFSIRARADAKSASSVPASAISICVAESGPAPAAGLPLPAVPDIRVSSVSSGSAKLLKGLQASFSQVTELN